MKYLKDFQFTLSYHPDKANVVIDVLSRKSRGMIAKIIIKEWDMVKTLNEFRIQVESQDTKVYLGAQKMMPMLISEIMEAQKHDQEVAYIKGHLESGEPMFDWAIHPNGSLRYQGRLFVPSNELLKEKIVIHNSPHDFAEVCKKLWQRCGSVWDFMGFVDLRSEIGDGTTTGSGHGRQWR
ncbi:uncharacterized protein LOC114261895 [Camellia sinensis]|uniref:uncharacterized protein LOC114261895 n=1 Tax=Camellia sinensis TaxID=4442 RepID=UPI001036B1AF|nr:uncharacterized protein LOC114261895 [Camellia sinensis]